MRAMRCLPISHILSYEIKNHFFIGSVNYVYVNNCYFLYLSCDFNNKTVANWEMNIIRLWVKFYPISLLIKFKNIQIFLCRGTCVCVFFYGVLLLIDFGIFSKLKATWIMSEKMVLKWRKMPLLSFTWKLAHTV